MDFATNSLRVEPVSPEMAAEFLRHNYAHNRKMRQNHIAYLLNEMRNGRFMPTAEIHLMYRNGEMHLVNGQHTCAAIVQLGKPMIVTVRKTIAREPGQIAMTYAFGHDTGLRRSFNDAMGAYNVAEQCGLTLAQTEALSTAIRHIREGFSSRGKVRVNDPKVSPVDLVEDVIVWAPEVRLLVTVTEGGDGKIIRSFRKRGVLSLAVITLYYQPEKAIDFWRQIATPDAIKWDDARVAARNTLDRATSKRGTASVTAEMLSRQLARCWKAHYDDEPLKQVKVFDVTKPIFIAGTPYNGRQPLNFLPTKGVYWSGSSRNSDDIMWEGTP